jgi:Zn-dependent peptidase ImmA (M78 family)
MDCLESCRLALGLAEIPLPVPVDKWIEHPLGITFGITDLSSLDQDGQTVLGAAFVKEREIFISERVLAHEGRYRFTCAHELGHLVLHPRVRATFHETAEATHRTSMVRYERQADRFAAAFLMPLPLLLRELFRIASDHGLDAKTSMVELMLGRPEAEPLWKRVFLPEITRRFGVSLSAAVNRFLDIRIQDGRPFLPRELVPRLLSPALAPAAQVAQDRRSNPTSQPGLWP